MRPAVESGRHIGLTISDPVLVQETNNTVVWLYPEPVIAKVATRREAARICSSNMRSQSSSSVSTPKSPHHYAARSRRFMRRRATS
jgi:hypothetical protein